MVPTMIWNSHGAIKICYNWNFLTTFFRETEKFWVNNCPISIKFGAFLVWSVLIVNTKFHQNRTIFGPYFGCEMHIKGCDIPKFWYFSSLTKLWKRPKFEKNPQLRSWGWFYTVSWNIGCGPTPILAGWDWKYFSHLNIFPKGPMGPSFDKIPEMVVLNVVMR